MTPHAPRGALQRTPVALLFTVALLFPAMLFQAAIAEAQPRYRLGSPVTTSFDVSFHVAACDLDNDGDVDVVAGNDGGEVRWFRNLDGQGTFGVGVLVNQKVEGSAPSTSSSRTRAAARPVPLAATATQHGRTGNAHFSHVALSAALQLQAAVTTNSNVRGIYCVDLDGDGARDLLVRYGAETQAEWFHNDIEAHEFRAGGVIPPLLSFGSMLTIGDVNRDGHTDVLAVLLSGDYRLPPRIVWFENSGHGVFLDTPSTAHDLAVVLPAPRETISSVELVDMDNDGDLDLVLSSGLSSRHFWYNNTDGRGAFDPLALPIGHLHDLLFIRASAIGDMNGDGRADILLAANSQTYTLLSYARGVSDAVALPYQLEMSPVHVTSDGSISLADVDLDGDLDVVLVDLSGERGVAWLENVFGNGTLAPEAALVATTVTAARVVATDVNGDNAPDLVFAAPFDSSVLVALNSGTPNFFAAAAVVNTTDEYGELADYDAVAIADLDGDGDLDIISALWVGAAMAFYENVDGRGRFEKRDFVSDNVQGASRVAIGDLDGDGKLDVVAASPNDERLLVFLQRDLGARVDPQETATNPARWALTTYSFGATGLVHLYDVDQDGDLDAIVGRGVSNTGTDYDGGVVWLENVDGRGTLEMRPAIFNTSDGLRALAVGDLDGDGDVDVVSNIFSAPTILWYENADGRGGVWREHTVGAAASGGFSLACADLDGDGDVDIVFASFSYGRVVMFRNTDGRGTFETAVLATQLGSPYTALPGDVDGDGDLDIVYNVAGDVSWLENIDGKATFQVRPAISKGLVAEQMAIGDLDGDGLPDVVAAGLGEIVWFRSRLGRRPFVLTLSSAAAGGDDAQCLARPEEHACATWAGVQAASDAHRAAPHRGAPTLRFRGDAVWNVTSTMVLTTLCRNAKEAITVDVPAAGLVLRCVVIDACLQAAGTRVPDEKRRVEFIGGVLTVVNAPRVLQTEATFPLLSLFAVRASLAASRETRCGYNGRLPYCLYSNVRPLVPRAAAGLRILPSSRGDLGVAIYAESSVLRLIELELSGFRGRLGGAIVAVGEGGALHLDRVTMIRNEATEGGAVIVYNDCSLAVTGGLYRSNVATADGGVFSVSGAATFLGDIHLDRNVAGDRGGAIWLRDSAVLTIALASTVTATNNTATRGNGGVFALENSRMVIDGALEASGNNAQSGGVIWAELATVVVSGAFFANDNEAAMGGGVAGCIGVNTVQNGALLISSEERLVFRRNRASRGGAVWAHECGLILSAVEMEDNVAVCAAGLTGVELSKCGGGAVYAAETRSFEIQFRTLLRNEARGGGSGGAVWFSPYALSATGAWTWPSLPAQLAGNRALGGGGSLLFWYPSSALGALAVEHAGSLASVLAPLSAAGDGVNNTSMYGGVVATPRVYLGLARNTVSGVPQNSRAALVGELELVLLDALNRTVQVDSTSIARVEARVTSASTALAASTEMVEPSALGSIALLARGGVFNFTGTSLAVQATPGARVELVVSLDVMASGDDTSLAARARLTQVIALDVRRCQPGERVVANRACEPCGAGTFSSRANADACELCPQNTVSATGASVCTPCGSREYTNGAGRSECLQCGSFHYARLARGNGTANGTIATCEPCPAHVDCLGFDRVVALRGYWISWDHDGYLRVAGCGETRCVGDGECAFGRAPVETNPLCGSCLPGYSLWNGVCENCADDNLHRRGALVFALILAFIALVFAYHVLSQNAGSARVKIFVNFVQIAVVTLGSEGEAFVTSLDFVSANPMRSRSTVCVANVSQFDQLMLGFAAPLFALAALAVVVLLVYARWRARRNPSSELPLHELDIQMSEMNGAPTTLEAGDADGGVSSSSSRANLRISAAQGGNERATRFSFARFSSTLVALYILTYVPVVRACFEFLDCVSVTIDGVDRRVVFGYPDVRCDSSQWRGAAVMVALAMLLWLLVIPAALVLMLWRHRHEEEVRAFEQSAAAEEREAPGRSATPESLSRSHSSAAAAMFFYPPTASPSDRIDEYLARVYRREVFFYETVVLTRRTVLLAVNVFLASSSNRLDRFLVTALVSSMFCALHVSLKPFRRDVENLVESVALFLLACLPVAVGIVGLPLTTPDGRAVVVLMVFLPALALLAWVLEDLWTRVRELRRRHDERVASQVRELARR